MTASPSCSRSRASRRGRWSISEPWPLPAATARPGAAWLAPWPSLATRQRPSRPGARCWSWRRPTQTPTRPWPSCWPRSPRRPRSTGARWPRRPRRRPSPGAASPAASRRPATPTAPRTPGGGCSSSRKTTSRRTPPWPTWSATASRRPCRTSASWPSAGRICQARGRGSPSCWKRPRTRPPPRRPGAA